jgi:hypothetical protein
MESAVVLQIYRDRVEQQQTLEAARNRQHALLGNSRLAVAAAAALVAWSAFGARAISPIWLGIPLVIYIGLAVWHDRVLQARRRASRTIAFYQRGIARLTESWQGAGEEGTRFGTPDHPYQADLDLFGRGSLFQLLSTARVRAGEETLARWLLAPAPPAEVRSRQEAVRELTPRLDLREQLAIVGEDVAAGVHPELLVSWGTAPAVPVAAWERYGARLLSLSTVVLLIIWFGWNVAAPAAVVALLLELVFALRARSRVHAILESAEEPAHDLTLLSGVLALFEAQSFESDKLRSLRTALDETGQPASRRIAQLQRLIDLTESRHNQFFAPIAAVLLWATQCAFALERWRNHSGRHLSVWLEVIGQFEALCSLASHAYEHPDDTFPGLVVTETLFDAEGLAHPLIAESRAVRNDVRLGSDRKLLVVSGSNMSGKSTLLRAVGVNAVLALAGAPVRARRLTLSPLAIGASLRIVDSLQAGKSRFYAEITRLRAIVTLTAGPLPVLFLLDELLSGTNSHDRRIGAEAIVRALLERNAIGLLTTHDLALAAIADLLAPVADNVHFADAFDAGGLTFDYKMRPGVVKTSNALALMRAVGLEVGQG